MAGERLNASKANISSPGIISTLEHEKDIINQCWSAVLSYPEEQRLLRSDFQPFVFLTAPEGQQLLLGNLTGRWYRSRRFVLKSVDLFKAVNNLEEMGKVMNGILHFSPGVPRIYSDSYRALLEQKIKISS